MSAADYAYILAYDACSYARWAIANNIPRAAYSLTYAWRCNDALIALEGRSDRWRTLDRMI